MYGTFYKDRNDRVELWDIQPSFPGFIEVGLLIVDSSVSNRILTVYDDKTNDPLTIKLPKAVVRQDLPAGYNKQVLPLYDRSL